MAITFKLATGSEDGEDFQDVYNGKKLIGKLTWWTGATEGWYFEDLKGVLTFVCSLSSGLDEHQEMVLIPLDEVKKLAIKAIKGSK